MKDFGFRWIEGICGNSMGIPTGFSVGMGWVWELKFSSHGSPAIFSSEDRKSSGWPHNMSEPVWVFF